MIELMVSVVIGLILAGGVMSLFVATLSTHNQNERVSRLDEELAAVMDLIVRDVRRAGFTPKVWEYAISASNLALDDYLDANNANFMAIGGANLGDADGLWDCFLYAYDKNGDGEVDDGTGDPDERFGIKVENGEIKKGYGTDIVSSDCTVGTWQPLTSSWAAKNIDVDFDLETRSVTASGSGGLGSAGPDVQLRAVIITLSGDTETNAASPDNASRTLTKVVRLRNDEIITPP